MWKLSILTPLNLMLSVAGNPYIDKSPENAGILIEFTASVIVH